MQTLDDYIAEQTATSPGFREELEAARRETEFAFQLARCREAKGLSQRELAQRAGILQPQLARIERGQIPSLPTLRLLAQALDTEIVIRPGDGAAAIELRAPRRSRRKEPIPLERAPAR